MDSSKAHWADVRHRALLHNSFGIFIAEMIFGDRTVNERGEIVKHPFITNSKGIKVQVRDIAEQHVIEDLGRIPSVGDFLQNMSIQAWFGGLTKALRYRNIEIDEKETVD